MNPALMRALIAAVVLLAALPARADSGPRSPFDIDDDDEEPDIVIVIDNL